MRSKEEDIRKIMANYRLNRYKDKVHYAVIIPLIQRGGEWHLLYEVRSSLISQPGDTSFPGGRVEPGETFQQAAIRETTEELNIDSNKIEVIGEIDGLINEVSVIHSYVALIKGINFSDICPNEKEVAYLFTIPLEYLLKNDPTYYEASVLTEVGDDFPYHLMAHGESYQFRVGKRKIPFYNLPSGEYLWGFTASMTQCFADIIRSDHKWIS
ncbi:NUDIX hydrolase [Facklamia miroungae]|uniref:NUDIX domain-containing protein n=1 Tax=Facklamia miroungae TaxID=120956 RepID=A0A1G7SJC3_9LACT|nr:CoA pyrophosphatase [Facklamia miroungae]NKZ29630.1 CoA pyrophosphatase [Facklamia miroungae]SDG23145.1 NUDIX domain-containing protein [Facklamia miroungae]